MNSPLSYVGGKSRLARTITNLICPHQTYVEVFAGAAWVFFRKEPSKYEIINDKDGDLICFYRVLQNHLEEFLRQFKWLLSSRQLFEEWKSQLPAGGLTDIQRAARYYYLQRQAFGGKVRGRNFGVSIESTPGINLLRMEEELSAVHLRLIKVVIENLDWKELLKRYDRPGTFFYLDPPYYKSPVYNHNLYKIEDYQEIADTLSQVGGKFLLSINNHPDIKKAFQKFKIRNIGTTYSVSQKAKNMKITELLISNY